MPQGRSLTPDPNFMTMATLSLYCYIHNLTTGFLKLYDQYEFITGYNQIENILNVILGVCRPEFLYPNDTNYIIDTPGLEKFSSRMHL